MQMFQRPGLVSGAAELGLWGDYSRGSINYLIQPCQDAAYFLMSSCGR